MTLEPETPVWRNRDRRAWRIGADAEIAWIHENTAAVGDRSIAAAIPLVFEAYATLELPGTGDRDPLSWCEDPDRHDASVLAVLTQHTTAQPWWLGYLETGIGAETIFYDVPKVTLYSDWRYVLVNAGPVQAGSWRAEWGRWKGILPDLMFPADRSWLASTLWDDRWTYIGGSSRLINAFLAHPDLRHRVRAVDPSVKDVTPPEHAPG